MSAETIRQLMKEIKELRLMNAKLLDLAKKAKERQDYWRGRYYDVIHHKESGVPDLTDDMPDFMKDLFK